MSVIPMSAYQREVKEAPSYIILSRPTNQTIADTTDTLVDFTAAPTIEAQTGDGLFDPAASTHITLKQTGLYVVSAWARFAANDTGGRRVWIEVGDNIVGYISVSANFTTHACCSAVFYGSQGQYVEMLVRQNSGGNLNIEAARLGLGRI